MTNSINLGLPFSKCHEPNCYIFKDLLQCGGCHIALYCSLQHQKSHRHFHKAQCKSIKDTEIKLAQAEKELRARSGDELCPANPFENAVGSFWFWEATRPYMRERHNLMLNRLSIGTGEAIKSALTDCLDMLRLCRGDNQSARDQVPALLLRLGRDQDAYDHIKWWATTGLSPTYDWRNPNEPFLDLHDEDAFEHSDVWMAKLWDLSFKTSLTLLKVRLLLDVKGLQAHVKTHPGLSYDKKMEWVSQEARSDIMRRRRDIVDRDNYDEIVADLKGQVNKLYNMTKIENRHYWPALLSPSEYCNAKPILCTPGSKEEVVLEFQRTWNAWSECPPAVEFIRKRHRTDTAVDTAFGMTDHEKDLSPRQSRTCNHCKARKVRCIFQAGASACGSCIKRKIPCEFSHTKRLLRRVTPIDLQGTPAPAPSNTVGNDLYIDRILENPGLDGVGMNDECIFKTHDRHLTSSNLAVFSESRLRLISQRLGHNQVRELVEQIWHMLEERALKCKPRTIPMRYAGSTSPCSVPEDEAAAYIKAYFEYVHPLYPFLNRQAFESKALLPDIIEYLEEQPAFSALYHTILALGCQYVGDGSFDPGQGRAWQLFQVPLAILPHILLPPDTEATLQAVTAMALFGINIPGMQIDELIFEAARIAIRMGCHRVITKRDTDSVSCYKTFWVIYILERMLCFFYGRSPTLADYDIGCPIPETPESNVEGVNFFVTALRGGRILSKAYQMLFSVSATMKSTDQYIHAIDEIKMDLDRWANSIPAKFRPAMPFSPGNSWTTFMLLRLHYTYHALVISLCRLELHIGTDQDTPRMRNTRQLLMNTARTVLYLTTFIELKPYTPLWMLGTIPGSAMFILFDFVIHNPTHIEAETNLRLLDTAAGYFGRLQYATGGSFPSMTMSGFAHIATDYVRRFQTENSTPTSGSELKSRVTQAPLNATAPTPLLFDNSLASFPNMTNVDVGVAQAAGPLYAMQPGVSPEPLFYPIANGDSMMNDDLLAGINFTNFFDSVIPEF